MTDPETVTRTKDSDLSRATQALHDAAVAYAVAKAGEGDPNRVARPIVLHRLTVAAEDYADAYLRGTP